MTFSVSLSVDEINRLLLELAKDIRHEFVPFLDDILLFLSELVEWKEGNLQTVSIGFGGISWIFKFLQKYIDIDHLKRYYMTYFARFLGNRRYFVRDFIAEVFAAILRSNVMLCAMNQMNQNGTESKSESESESTENDKVLLLRNDIFSLKVRDHLFESDQLIDGNQTRQDFQCGLSVLLFQIVRGILKGFHSKTEEILPLILRILKRQRVDDDDDAVAAQREREEAEHQIVIFREFLDLAAAYTTTEYCERFAGPLIETLYDHLVSIRPLKEAKPESDSNSNSQIDSKSDSSFGADLDFLNRLLVLVGIWTAHNGGEVVPMTMSSKVVQLLKRLTNKQWIDTVMQFGSSSNDEDAVSQYLQNVLFLIINCCKIYGFKQMASFRKCAQNGIVVLLEHCGSDISIIQLIVDRLGGTDILNDDGMRSHILKWIESISHSVEHQRTRLLFLDLLNRSKSKQIGIGIDSNMMGRVKQLMTGSVTTTMPTTNDTVQQYMKRMAYQRSKEILESPPMLSQFPQRESNGLRL